MLLLADSREGNEDDQDNSSNDSESLHGEGAGSAVRNTIGSGVISGVQGDGGDSRGGEFKDSVELGQDGLTQDGVVDILITGIISGGRSIIDEESVKIVSNLSSVGRRREGEVFTVGQTNGQFREGGQGSVVEGGVISICVGVVGDVKAIFGFE